MTTHQRLISLIRITSYRTQNNRHLRCIFARLGEYLTLGCARFAEILQNFSEYQILWSLCSVLFRTLTLKLPIQTSLSVAHKLTVSLSSAENCQKI